MMTDNRDLHLSNSLSYMRSARECLVSAEEEGLLIALDVIEQRIRETLLEARDALKPGEDKE
jgi:hypothetical protein